MNVEESIKKYVKSLNLTGEILTDDLELLQSGFLNSLNFIKLIAYLQDEHKINTQVFFSNTEEGITIKRILNVIKQ